MPDSEVVAIHATLHPEAVLRRVGFALDHPYVEHCWSAVVGPTSTLLLRRLPLLWREQEPAVVQVRDLARSLGLGGETGKLRRVLGRLVDFGFANRPGEGVLEVYTAVRPLTPRQVERLPEWSQQTHSRLLGAHLDELAASTARMNGRLDHLERGSQTSHVGLGR